MRPKYKGIRRIRKAFKYSHHGLKTTYKSEAAFRQELIICACLFVLILFLPVNYIQFIFLASSLFFILIMELINTAIETIVDRISDEYHNLSKKAKDIGSLMVLLSFISMFITWGIVLYQIFIGNN